MPVFHVLGPLEIHSAAGRPLSVPGRRQCALLVLLLLRSGAVVTVDAMIDALWGDHPPASARANLHSHMSGLRRLLAGAAPTIGPRPVTTPGGYRMDLVAGECDAEVFEELAGHGRRALADGRPEVAAEHLGRALGLWRGRAWDTLADFDWAIPHAVRLEQLRLATMEDHAEARLLLGRHAELSLELAVTAAQHPVRERLWAQLMVALYRSGRRTEASDAYRRLSTRLDVELGIRPSPDLRDLHLAIVQGSSARVQTPWRALSEVDGRGAPMPHRSYPGCPCGARPALPGRERGGM